MNKYILFVLSCGFSFYACDNNDDVASTTEKSIHVLADKMLIEQNIDKFYAFHYASESALPTVVAVPVGSDGSGVFRRIGEENDKIIVFAGNGLDISDMAKYSYVGMQQLTTASSDYIDHQPGLYWVAETHSGDGEPFFLQKSISRVDIEFKSSDFDIDSCVVTGLADRSLLIPTGNTPRIETGSAQISLRSEDNGDVIGSFYAHESDVAPKVHFYVNENGVSRVIEGTMTSSIERGKVYKLSLSETSSEIKTVLNILDWDEGGSLIVGPGEFAYRIDESASQFPSYVRLSEGRDTIYVPSCNTELILALDAAIETCVRVEGAPLNIEHIDGGGYLENTYKIKLTQNATLNPEVITRLFFSEKGSEYSGNSPLVIVQAPSRLKLTTTDVSIDGNVVTYPGYMDGTLATFDDAFKVASYSIGSDGMQYQWVTLHSRRRKFTIEGAFKPNDAEASGQRQVSSVSIKFTDGVEEHHTFSRVRESLPVVKLGDIYWAKYNMRGNSKDFNDQVGLEQDQADLWSFFKSCNDDQYMYYSGNEYGGANPQGLELEKNASGKLVYKGYSDAFGSGSISDIMPDSHCPRGYEVPTGEVMRSIVGSYLTLLSPLRAGQEHTDRYLINQEGYTVQRYKRNPLVKDGVVVDEVYQMKITNSRGESLVFSGLGFQSDPTEVAWGYWLYATADKGRNLFGINHRSNYFSLQSHSGKKTTLVRCVKSPVNYIL